MLCIHIPNFISNLSKIFEEFVMKRLQIDVVTEGCQLKKDSTLFTDVRAQGIH